MDPTPARYTWTVGQSPNCDQANIALTPVADAWVDEVVPNENFVFYQELTVRSQAEGDPEIPSSLVGANARALVRFDVENVPHCKLESATLRLYPESHDPGREIEVVPLAGPFKESTVTWLSQPATRTGFSAPKVASGEGYREWDVTSHVQGLIDAGQTNYGWQVRDAHENDPDGGEQSFSSRETLVDPPEMVLPELVLQYEADQTPAPPPPELPAGIEPTTVHCGETLTKSTLIGNDLNDCPGEGLVVGASNVVIDLNGHTIDGPNYLLENVSGQEEGFPAGIRVSGRTNVIVRNGTVQEFGYGVLLTSGTTRTVVGSETPGKGLTIATNAMSGVELFDADDGRNGNTIVGNTIHSNELGVTLLAGSDNSVVKNNVLHGNLGEAVLIQFSRGHLIEGNEMVGIPIDPNLDSDGGVLLEGSSNNVLRNNEIRDTGDAGVAMPACTSRTPTATR
jgi:parallel beta-helix repeat protein